jgi:hypothetical protein
MNAKTMKMDAKKLMVSIMAIAIVLSLVANVSAADEIANNLNVKVNDDLASDLISVTAGETITVKVMFNALVDASDVTVRAEIEGSKVDSNDLSAPFDVETGLRYSKTLNVEVPYELKDEVSDNVTLTVTIKQGSKFKTTQSYNVRVQRPSYNAEVMSIVTANTIQAGDVLPVDIVLKNVGYNNLDDVYMTARITALNGVERTVYFGDLVALEDDADDESTTASSRINLQMPFNVEPGIYTLVVEVSNDDFNAEASKQIIVENDFPNTVIKAGNDLLIVNPTDKLVVYKVIFPESEQFVTIDADSSKTVQVMPTSDDYTVSVVDMKGELVNTFTFSAVEDASVTSPIVVLTIILAIVFLVLLVVLIVLIGKKPEKVEEFGESYY